MASGVEPIASSGGLACLFAWLCRAVAHVFGDQALLASNDLFCFSLAFDHLGEFLLFFFFSFSLLRLCVDVLTMHSSRGRLRTHGGMCLRS